MKFCARCNDSLPLTFFPKANTPDGHSHLCDVCTEADFVHMNKIQTNTSTQKLGTLDISSTPIRSKHARTGKTHK